MPFLLIATSVIKEKLKHASMLNTSYELKDWVPNGHDAYKWFMWDIQTTFDDKIRYEQLNTNAQIKSLRIGHTQARQNITYLCKNSFAHKDSHGKTNSFVKLLSNNGDEVHVNGHRHTRLDVIRDDCHIKDGKERQTVFHYTSFRSKHLPIIDVAIYDVADSDEAFGLEIGPVCFL